ncbi:LPXTG cell wall anchor domain-containing protein [Actinomyces vulturis]|uniref:LPXTG cell wall anchor domain-containing protein n=1 Tax=Actinomyces vulturis TaxID=1857645 RepID=UPI00159EC102|nr:LPXTG cell wall anchor domain-containing protein [Actinomyces vulturis]
MRIQRRYRTYRRRILAAGAMVALVGAGLSPLPTAPEAHAEEPALPVSTSDESGGAERHAVDAALPADSNSGADKMDAVAGEKDSSTTSPVDAVSTQNNESQPSTQGGQSSHETTASVSDEENADLRVPEHAPEAEAIPMVEPAPSTAGNYTVVPRRQLQAVYADSVDNSVIASLNSGPMDRVLDGDYSSFWLSNTGEGEGPVEAPHRIIVGTRDGQAVENVGRLTIYPTGIMSGVGHLHEYEVFVRADGECANTDDGWFQVPTTAVDAQDLSPVVLSFAPRAVNCVRIDALSGWYQNKPTDYTSISEISWSTFAEGEVVPLADPEPTQLRERPLAEGARPSGETLNALAFDDRVAENRERTPIALTITDPDGTSRVVGARPSPINVVAGAAQGKAYHVDCIPGGPEGDGSIERPFTSLERINAHEPFKPGDQILLKRGTRCQGLLHPHGSGSQGNPIEINAYGDPAAPMPRIDGGGERIAAGDDLPEQLASQENTGVDSATVRLYNQEHWVIRNLEVTNFSGDGNDYSVRRRGVLVTLDNYGDAHGFEISNMYVHDVLGHTKKDLEGSAGIQFEVYGTADGTPSAFYDVEISYNRVRHVNRSGINMGTSYRKRPSVGAAVNSGPALKYHGWGPMDIHDNIVWDIGGDGIVTQYANGSRNFNNTVYEVSNHHGGLSYSGNNAAMWPWNADNVSYTNNHVFDTRMPHGTWDGTAFDADYGQNGTLVEHNVTHDNEGGFMLFCGFGGYSMKAIARYNLSINDGHGAETHSYGPRAWALLGQTDGEMYNNTFVLYPGAYLGRATRGNYRDNIAYVNNVFFAQGDVQTTWGPRTYDVYLESPTQDDIFSLPPIVPMRNNLYAGTDQGWPNLEANYVMPELRAGSTLESLIPSPEVISGKGEPILSTSMEDLWGRTVSELGRPDLGAFQLTASSLAPIVANGGFEQGLEGWQAQGDIAVTQSSAAPKTPLKYVFSGAHAAQLTQGASLTQTFPGGVNRSYVLRARVKAGEGATLPTVTLVNEGGYQATSLVSDVDAQGWADVTVLMRTAWEGSPLTISLTGPGIIDDVSVIVVPDYVVDGSFQARGVTKQNPENTPWNLSPSQHSDDAVSGGRSGRVSGPASNGEVLIPKTGNYLVAGFLKPSFPDEVMTLDVHDGAQGSGTTSGENWKQVVFRTQAEDSLLTVTCASEESSTGLCDDIMVVPDPGPAPRVDGQEPLSEPTVSGPDSSAEPTSPAEESTVAPSTQPDSSSSAPSASSGASGSDEPGMLPSDASRSSSTARPQTSGGSLPTTGTSGSLLVLAGGLMIAGVASALRARRHT